jgi:hypothetical protein
MHHPLTKLKDPTSNPVAAYGSCGIDFLLTKYYGKHRPKPLIAVFDSTTP